MESKNAVIKRIKLFVFYQFAAFASIIWADEGLQFIKDSQAGTNQRLKEETTNRIFRSAKRTSKLSEKR